MGHPPPARDSGPPAFVRSGSSESACRRHAMDELEAQDRLRKVLELLLEVDLERMSTLLEGRKSKDKDLYNGV